MEMGGGMWERREEERERKNENLQKGLSIEVCRFFKLFLGAGVNLFFWYFLMLLTT